MKGRPSCRACGGREYARAEEACAACGDVGAQARDWLEMHGESVHRAAGHPQDSHGVVYKMACWLVRGFNLGAEGSRPLLESYLASRSDLPWSDGEIRHKCESALASNGEAGSLIWRGMSGKRPDGGAEYVAWEARQETYKELVENAREFDAGELGRQALRAGRAQGEAWLARVSPVDVAQVTPEVFLTGCYEPGERLLVFTVYESQAQFLYEVPGLEPEAKTAGAWALSPQRGQSAQRVEQLPREGRLGVWWMCQPVTGLWMLNRDGARARKGEVKYGRRHGDCVTAWRYMVLESDEPGVEWEWVQFLCDLPLPIVALYTSGGRSVHALVRVNAVSKADWDAVRAMIKPLLTQNGADKGVFSAVRLTRLPGCLRHGKMVTEDGGSGRETWQKYGAPLRQRLLYFNPAALPGEVITGRRERVGAGK